MNHSRWAGEQARHNQHGEFGEPELSPEAQNYLKAFTRARVAECLHLGPELKEAQAEMKELAKDLVGPILQHRAKQRLAA